MSFVNPNDKRLQKYRAAKAERRNKAIETKKIRESVIALHPDWSAKKVEQVVSDSYRIKTQGGRRG